MTRRLPLFLSRVALRRFGKATPKQKRGQVAHRAGLVAESLACFFLMLKGYRIIARRLRTPYGEIDLLATRGDTLVVAEVKTRPTLLAASESIAGSQKERLMRAAAFFVAHHPPFKDFIVRFDALLVRPLRWPHHIPNAWEAF